MSPQAKDPSLVPASLSFRSHAAADPSAKEAGRDTTGAAAA